MAYYVLKVLNLQKEVNMYSLYISARWVIGNIGLEAFLKEIYRKNSCDQKRQKITSM